MDRQTDRQTDKPIAILCSSTSDNNNTNNNTRVDKKEQQKVDKYQDLESEIKRLWRVKARVIPIIIGALATISRGLKETV